MAKKNKPQAPPAPTPRDFKAEIGQIGSTARSIAQAQADQTIGVNRSLTNTALGATKQISRELNNDYTRRATDQIIAAQDQAGQLGRLGDYTEQLGYQAATDLSGTDIERELQRQALSELQLGRALSPEQARAATQAARAGMSARGLGVGNAALAAEILNRDAYASQREAERRNFAGQTNQLLVGNRQNRLGMVGNLIGQSANTRMNQANLRTNLAQANIGLDPYQRALGSNIPIASQGNAVGMIGQAYGQTMGYGSDLYNTNTNMQASLYNSFQNNQAALRGASMQAAASRDAATKTMIGSIAGSLF
jgi:hypothetical protein